MITPQFTFAVDDRRLSVHLDELPRQLQRQLRFRIQALTQSLLTGVIAAEPARTGYLRSQTRAYVDERPNWIRGRVRIRPTGRAQWIGAYFGALEYGVHSAFTVKAHRARLTHMFGRAVSPRSVAIPAHLRRVDITERRFLRRPGAVVLARARTEIQEAINTAVAETQRR